MKIDYKDLKELYSGIVMAIAVIAMLVAVLAYFVKLDHSQEMEMYTLKNSCPEVSADE